MAFLAQSVSECHPAQRIAVVRIQNPPPKQMGKRCSHKEQSLFNENFGIIRFMRV